jgi:hypothetical protein
MSANVRHWLRHLGKSVIYGTAGAVLTMPAFSMANAAGANVPVLNLQAFGTVLFSAVVGNLCVALMKEPLPPDPTDTEFFHKPTDKPTV